MSHEKKYPRAIVTWEDTWGRNSYVSKDDFAKELLRPTLMESIGWIVAENDERIALAFEFDDDGDSRKTQSIPRKVITHIEYLRSKKVKHASANT